jgi:hypothetical protein
MLLYLAGLRSQAFFVLDYSRLSSRFSEYIFQALRACNHSSTTFTAVEAEDLLSIICGQLIVEMEEGLKVPSSKRGAARGQAAHYSPEVWSGSP